MSVDSTASNIYTDLQGLAELRASARQGSPDALRVVAKQFEAYLVQQLLRTSREASLGNGILDNEGSELYQDLFDKQIALSATAGKGLGIADLLVKQVEQARGGMANGEAVPEPLQMHAPAPAEEVRGADSEAPPAANPALLPPPFATGTKSVANSTPEREGPTDARVRFGTAQEFAAALMPHARRVGAELGVDPRFLVAQAALETGWGKSIIRNSDGTSSHNLFNIKAHGSWDGPVAAARTLEYENGAKVKVRAGFRSYESFEASFRDYVDFLRSNPRYREALQQTGDVAAFARSLQAAGYATDPRYADKLLTIYGMDELTSAVT